MARGKTTRKQTVKKRRIRATDGRLLQQEQKSISTPVEKLKQQRRDQKEKKEADAIKEIAKAPSGMFLLHNENLAPPYQVIVDTNFINFSIQHKLDVMQAMLDCLLAKCIPCVTDCVVGELEKMGHRFRLALKLARDPRFKRLTCTHKGTYADDCIVSRVEQHRCYIVATADRDLKRRLRKIPGVPIMYVAGKKYAIERLPGAMVNIPLGSKGRFKT